MYVPTYTHPEVVSLALKSYDILFNPLYITYYLQIPIAYDVCVLLSLIDLKLLEMKSWVLLNYGWMKQPIIYLYIYLGIFICKACKVLDLIYQGDY